MKIVIPGGSGQVGTVLARALHTEGHDVVALSRRPVPRSWRVIAWDGVTLGDWAKDVNGCDAVINLAGRSVNCRYNAANRRAILDSRVLSTRVVAQAVSSVTRPPRVWLQASTATIYAHRYDAPNDERSGVVGGLEPGAPNSWKFSIDVARAWEATFAEAIVPRTRKVALRSALTLSPDRGGIFDTLLGLVRRGLGGPPVTAGSTSRGFTTRTSWRRFAGCWPTTRSTASSTWLHPIQSRTQISCGFCGTQRECRWGCQPTG